MEWALTAGIAGACLGSFANVVLHRVPRRASVVSPPSGCPACSRRLSPWEMVPILSYLVLAGRCRSCRHPIGVRYLLVELGAGLGAAAAAAGGGPAAGFGTALLVPLLAWLWARRLRPIRPAGWQQGSLMAEIAVSAVLLVLVVGGLMESFTVALANLTVAQQRAVALNLARSKLEEWRSRPWPDLVSRIGSETTDFEQGHLDFTIVTDIRYADSDESWVGDGSLLKLSVKVEFDPRGKAAHRTSVWLGTLRGQDVS